MRRKTPFLSLHRRALKAPVMAPWALCPSTWQGHWRPVGRALCSHQVREFREAQGGQVQEPLSQNHTFQPPSAPATFPSLPATLKLVSVGFLWVSLTLVITVGNSATNQDSPKLP